MDRYTHDEPGVSSQRRRLLKMLALASIAPTLTLGCAGSMPQRAYKRPFSRDHGGGGRSHRGK